MKKIINMKKIYRERTRKFPSREISSCNCSVKSIICPNFTSSKDEARTFEMIKAKLQLCCDIFAS